MGVDRRHYGPNAMVKIWHVEIDQLGFGFSSPVGINLEAEIVLNVPVPDSIPRPTEKTVCQAIGMLLGIDPEVITVRDDAISGIYLRDREL